MRRLAMIFLALSVVSAGIALTVRPAEAAPPTGPGPLRPALAYAVDDQRSGATGRPGDLGGQLAAPTEKSEHRADPERQRDP